ncbi:hypothetical protein [Alkalicoccus urumqiensis]|uniref:hypothetical protein n=1 Tax=Alkalicoccus urumqiensis TaxID=1548213 RepID=UPI0015E6091B|nr:hypothetical protein [Alkalicoccus urumqiensis]
MRKLRHAVEALEEKEEKATVSSIFNLIIRSFLIGVFVVGPIIAVLATLIPYFFQLLF